MCEFCLGIRFEKVVGWQALDHLEDQLAHLLDVQLRNEVSRPLLNNHITRIKKSVAS